MQVMTKLGFGGWGPLLAQSAVDRWRGARASAQADHGSTWMWTALLGALLLVFAAALVGLVIRRLRRDRRAWKLFAQQAKGHGFDAEQQEILTRIARLAGMRNPLAIFTVAQAFDRGAEGYLHSPAFTGRSGADQDWARLQIPELRSGMAYPQSGPGGNPDARNTRSLPAGTALTVFRPDRNELFDAEIISTNAVDMAVQAKRSTYCRTGELVLVQFSDGRQRYEFETTVVRARNGRILLDHNDQALPAESRRHVPIALRRPARIAKLPDDFDTVERMDYFDARLIQVIGPRVTLQSPVQAAVGQSLLVELDLGGAEFVQAPGVVSALPHGQKPGKPVTYVVDLDGISEGDLQFMVRSAADVQDRHVERLERRSRPRRPGDRAPAPDGPLEPSQTDAAADQSPDEPRDGPTGDPPERLNDPKPQPQPVAAAEA